MCSTPCSLYHSILIGLTNLQFINVVVALQMTLPPGYISGVIQDILKTIGYIELAALYIICIFKEHLRCASVTSPGFHTYQ